jgi:hypothetical protein
MVLNAPEQLMQIIKRNRVILVNLSNECHSKRINPLPSQLIAKHERAEFQV